jgi:hypothetical protein
VAPVVEPGDGEPASRQVRDELAVAPEMLGVPVRDDDDPARRRRRGGALPGDRETADTDEGAALGPHAGRAPLRTRATASCQPR